MLTRRAFLAGVGGLICVIGAVGVTEWVEHPAERQHILHRIGLAASPDNQVSSSGAVEVSGRLASRYTHASMAWTISTPGDHRAPDAIVFCLHGKGGNHRTAFDQIHVPDVAASIGMPIAVAAIDGGSDSYWHPRANGTDALAMLLDEFVPLVRQRVGPLPQATMGWSMGGYGALLAAERTAAGHFPAAGSFRAVAAASPALWLSPGQTAPGAFDSAADFYANDVYTAIAGLDGLGVAVACGTGDPFYAATRQLVSMMAFPHQFFSGPGFHDDAYWRSVAPAQLKAIAPTLGIALRPR